MKSFDYQVRDELGIHARPAGQLAKLAKSLACEVTLTLGEKAVDVTKLVRLMSLGVKQGDVVTLSVVGESEDEACKTLQAFFAENL